MTQASSMQSIQALPGVRAGALVEGEGTVVAEAPSGAGRALLARIAHPTANAAVRVLETGRTLVLELDENCQTREALLDVAAYLLSHTPESDGDGSRQAAAGEPLFSPMVRTRLERALSQRLGAGVDRATVRSLVQALNQPGGDQSRQALQRLVELAPGERALDLLVDVQAQYFAALAESVAAERQAVRDLLDQAVRGLRTVAHSSGEGDAPQTLAVVHGLEAAAEHWSRSDSMLLMQQAAGVRSLADGMAVNAIELLRLKQGAVAARRARRELETAVEVQRLVAPTDAVIEDPAFTAVTHGRAATGCSGDLWVLHRLDDRQLFLLIGDVTGHGVGPAMVAMLARAACETALASAGANVDGVRVLQAIDRALSLPGAGKLAMTALAARFDFKRCTLSIWSAGNPCAVALRAGRPPREIIAAGPMLGTTEDHPIEHRSIQFQSGDAFVFYTDGVIDLYNPRGEAYGAKRLRRLLQQVSHQGSVAICRSIERSLSEHAGNAPLTDDLTLVVIKAQ